MPRSAGHRPGRTAMAAGGRAGRARGPAGGRAAFSASAQSPAWGALGAHARGLRCLRAAGCGAHAARGSLGHRERSNAAGAERSASRAAHPASRRAESAAGERAGGRRKTRTGTTERGGGRAGRGKEGGAQPPSAARAGHPQLRGSLLAMLEAPPGRDWGGGRGGLPPPLAVSRDRARSLKPGVDCFLDPGSPRTQVCAQVAREGSRLRRPRRGASLQRAAWGRGARGRFRCSLLPPPHPTPRLRAALRGRQRAAVRHQPAAWIGDCGRAPRPRPARIGSLAGQIPDHLQSQARNLVGPSVTQGFPNPTVPFA